MVHVGLVTSDINYCQRCGHALADEIVEGSPRRRCAGCGLVAFLDSKVAAAVLVLMDGALVMVKRGVEPALGRWAFPSGFGPGGPADRPGRPVLGHRQPRRAGRIRGRGDWGRAQGGPRRRGGGAIPARCAAAAPLSPRRADRRGLADTAGVRPQRHTLRLRALRQAQDRRRVLAPLHSPFLGGTKRYSTRTTSFTIVGVDSRVR